MSLFTLLGARTCFVSPNMIYLSLSVTFPDWRYLRLRTGPNVEMGFVSWCFFFLFLSTWNAWRAYAARRFSVCARFWSRGWDQSRLCFWIPFFLSIDYNSSKVNIFPGDSRNISRMPPIGLVLGSPRFPLISRVQHQLVCARMLASRVAHKLRSFSYIPLGGRDVTNVFWES